MSYKCPVCRMSSQIESSSNTVICCSECYYWFHASCTELGSLENINQLDLKKWKCSRCKDKSLTYMKPNTEGLDGKIIDLQRTMTSAFRNSEEIKATLAYLEDEVKNLQMENSRIHNKNGVLWKTYTRLQEEVDELQNVLNNRVVSENHIKNTSLSFFMKVKELVFYGILHGTLMVTFAFFFSRYLQKKMKITTLADKWG